MGYDGSVRRLNLVPTGWTRPVLDWPQSISQDKIFVRAMRPGYQGVFMKQLFVALLLLTALPMGVQGVQDGPVGQVVGFVFDSTTGETLSGARVALWGTAFQAETDGGGTFRIVDVPVGEYSVVFFHPRLAHLGISTGAGMIEVEEGESDPVQLATPSMTTILGNECLLDTGDPTAPAVVGQVVDGAEGVGIPNADVSLRWMESNRPRVVPVQTDTEGWFRACGLPKGYSIAGTASFLSMTSPRRVVESRASQVHRVDFLLGSLSASNVAGTLTESTTGAPIAGAEVRLRDTDFFTVSDDQGNFSIIDVEPGEYFLDINHIAYAPREETIDVGSDLGVHLGIEMAQEAIALEPIVVTVEARTMAEALSMGGYLVESAALEPTKERVSTLADLLFQQNIPGLRVERAEGNICAEFASGTVRFMKTSCESATFYIDGARQVDPRVLMDLPDEIVDHIVVFRPVEAGALFGTGGSRGVVMIYTKTGRPRG